MKYLNTPLEKRSMPSSMPCTMKADSIQLFARQFTDGEWKEKKSMKNSNKFLFNITISVFPIKKEVFSWVSKFHCIRYAICSAPFLRLCGGDISLFGELFSIQFSIAGLVSYISATKRKRIRHLPIEMMISIIPLFVDNNHALH